ncbi:alpha/beta hydrolase [Ureibacillus acetophenoni]|uniref:Esterase/lipase n=1 Tax=Ureibacillus acetophenoni TaxID=614649 RepID=A0A285U5X8_9BACL|nr:alpha/beta fold hydrolase [Ureibacillus acetophenoni]SOC37123.1 esterase/lipase [Ureibacillus acetophenoni]
MNEIHPNDIYLKGNKVAILLLHSFTSSAKEMRGLANYLHEHGFSCYAPNYKGHGESPDRLFQSSVEEAWETAEEAIQFLQKEGYENIIVVGQSLGGVMALRLASKSICKAIVTISAPIFERPIETLEDRMRHYTNRYYRKKNKTEEWIEVYINQHFPRPVHKLKDLQQFILKTQTVLNGVTKPILLAKGGMDDQVFQESIDLIESSVQSSFKRKTTYTNSGHLITMDKDRERLFLDIQLFVEQVLKSEKIYS